MIYKNCIRFLGVVSVFFLSAGCYNIEWDGRSVDEILSMPAEDAKVEDIEKLSKKDIIQLFLAADSPEISELDGEYNATLISPNLFSNYYSDNLMGPGDWLGKAFLPLEEDKGFGYNLFETDDGIVRTMKMDTYIDISRFDDKDSFHIVYKAYNPGLNKSMHDELRKINDELYLGVGTVSWSLDTLNPMPFAIYGNPNPWIGPNK